MLSKTEKILYVDVDHMKHETTFWLHSERNGVRDNIWYDGESTMCSTIDEGCAVKNDLKPFLRLPKPIADQFIELVAQYAQQRGIAQETESETKGKLISKELHLSDMKEINMKLLEIVANAK